jgi:predicted DCC family thiol-disulfide oxidoreductase YuxK
MMAADGGAQDRASPGRLALLYDGSCELCAKAIDRALRLDRARILEPLDLHQPAARERFPGLSPESLMEELHAVDDEGRVFRGASAIREILRRQTGITSLVARLWDLPGFARLADRHYRRIAASRHGRT